MLEPDPTSMTPEIFYDDQREVISPRLIKPLRTRNRYKPTPSPSSASPSETDATDEDARGVEMNVAYSTTGTAVIQKEPVFTGYVIAEGCEQDAKFVAPFGQSFHDFDAHSAPSPSPMDSHFSCDSIASPDDMLLSLSGEQITFGSGPGVFWGHDHYSQDHQFLFTVGNDDPFPSPDLYSNLAYMPIEEPRKHVPLTHIIEDYKPEAY
jgi:hypothetical protein